MCRCSQLHQTSQTSFIPCVHRHQHGAAAALAPAPFGSALPTCHTAEGDGKR